MSQYNFSPKSDHSHDFEFYYCWIFPPTVFTYFLGLLTYLLYSSFPKKLSRTCWLQRRAIEKDHTWATQWSMRTELKEAWGEGDPKAKLQKSWYLPVFHVLLPFSQHSQLRGHKPRCPSDVFPLVHTNIFKFSSNLPAFKMGKLFCKNPDVPVLLHWQHWARLANGTTAGRAERHLSPHTHSVLDTFPCAQLFYIWPISFLLSALPR